MRQYAPRSAESQALLSINGSENEQALSENHRLLTDFDARAPGFGQQH